MDEFLRKHDVDVGKTFGILLFAAAIGETYNVFFDLLYRDRLILNLGILVLLALGWGMYRHGNTSRKWCLGLTLFSAVVLVATTVLSPFISGECITIAGEKFPNPPLWKLIITDVALAPAFWAIIRALTSGKAKEEFGVAEQS